MCCSTVPNARLTVAAMIASKSPNVTYCASPSILVFHTCKPKSGTPRLLLATACCAIKRITSSNGSASFWTRKSVVARSTLRVRRSAANILTVCVAAIMTFSRLSAAASATTSLSLQLSVATYKREIGLTELTDWSKCFLRADIKSLVQSMNPANLVPSQCANPSRR